jgi:hypothetical protein
VAHAVGILSSEYQLFDCAENKVSLNYGQSFLIEGLLVSAQFERHVKVIGCRAATLLIVDFVA